MIKDRNLEISLCVRSKAKRATNKTLLDLVVKFYNKVNY